MVKLIFLKLMVIFPYLFI